MSMKDIVWITGFKVATDDVSYYGVTEFIEPYSEDEVTSKYISEAKHKQAIAEAVQAVRDKLELEIDALSDTFLKDLEKANSLLLKASLELESWNLQAGDEDTNKLIIEIGEAIRNSGKGEGE